LTCPSTRSPRAPPRSRLPTDHLAWLRVAHLHKWSKTTWESRFAAVCDQLLHEDDPNQKYGTGSGAPLGIFQMLDHVLGLGLTCRQMTTNDGRSAAPKVAPERDPLGMINGEGVITGTVVSAAVIAAAAGHLEETRIVLAILGTAFIYWLAHLHARTLGDAIKHRTHPVDALKEALAETWPILAAALVPAAILLVTQLAGVQIRTGAWIAVIGSTVLLTVYSFLAGRRGGLGLGGSLVSAAIGAALGLLVVGLKASLH
jgi:hypothetical protein